MFTIFMKKLTVNQAINEAHTSENSMLIDCRPKAEYTHGHVSGAVNIPLDKITEDRITRRIPDKETKLYIIGNYGYKPNDAISKFKKLGYKNLVFGGFMEEHHGLLAR